MLYDILLLFHLPPRHVFFMNSCNLEVKDVRLSSTVLCVSSSLSRDQTHISCIGRWILNYWITREVLVSIFKD